MKTETGDIFAFKRLDVWTTHAAREDDIEFGCDHHILCNNIIFIVGFVFDEKNGGHDEAVVLSEGTLYWIPIAKNCITGLSNETYSGWTGNKL